MTPTLASQETAPGGRREVDGVVPSALRADLAISRQLFEGRAYVIIKDPLSLKYFRLQAEDYALAALFDGRRSVAEVRAEFLRLYPHTALAQSAEGLTQRITAFASELLLAGFLEATAAGVRHQMAREKMRRKPVGPWGWFMKALFLKLPLWDPDRVLTRMERPLRALWSWPGFIISLVIFAGGLAVFVFNYPRIEPSLNNFLTLPNLAAIWVLTMVVKIIHEFGHGLTCKHYGGEVHEMGAMVIVLSPFLYADVTDSYLFPKKRHRVLVAAAGIYVELIIAAIATLLWAVSQPGPTQQLLFNLMLITSVWTVVFNANPLMKFDGYYMLTDLVGVPNLRTKAQLCVREMARRFFLGPAARNEAVEAMLPRRRRGWFVLYSMAAQLYLLYVTLGISALFHHLLTPYGLAWLGDLLGAGALISMLIVPVVSFFSGQLFPKGAPAASRLRPALMLAGLAALVGLGLLCPWQVKVERPALVQPVESEVVRAQLPGRLVEVRVKEGQEVKAGDLLARLENLRVTAEVSAAELRLERARRELDLTVGADAPAAYKQAQTAEAQAETVLEEARRQARKLELRSSIAGVVLTPDLERLGQASLRPGDALCQVAGRDPVELFIPLTEREARHIEAGQVVEFRIPSQADRTFRGRVVEDRKTPPTVELPPNLAATLGGDLAAEPDAEGRLKPVETVYGVRVALENPGGVLRPGMTGSARVHGGRVSLGRHLWQKVLDFVSFDYRL